MCSPGYNVRMIGEGEQQTGSHSVVATAGGMRAIPNKRAKRPGGHLIFEPDDLVREQANGFADFLRNYAVVGLATGYIIGQEANTVVKQLVDSFIQPWLQVLFGPKLSSRVAIVHHDHSPIQLPWGAFAYALVEFLFVVAGIYVVIKFFRLDKLRKN